MRRPLIPWLGLISVVLVAVSVVLDLTVHRAAEPNEVWTNALMASAWIAGGLTAWARRPDNRCGLLMSLVGWPTSIVAIVIWVAWLVPTVSFRLAAHNAYYVSMYIATFVTSSVVPLAFLGGLLRTHLHRGALAELIVELDRASAPASPEAAIVRALGDPRARLGFWLPEQCRYVDFDGHPMDLPSEGGGQAVKLLESGGAPLAVLVYDPALLEDRTMLDAVGSAARLSLENARLHARLRAQLAEVRASRARIVEASDAERRKIERNLHDGAQQRLLGIRLALRLARSEVDDTDVMQALRDEADAEVAATLNELRRLARGIHPVVLEEAGLRPALDDLARRCPIPVAVTALNEHLPRPVEAAAYFVVSEALANVIKHANARTATVDVAREDGRLIVDITDDGVGGASIERGTGLRNLQDRVAVLSGVLSVHSDPGMWHPHRGGHPVRVTLADDGAVIRSGALVRRCQLCGAVRSCPCPPG